MLVYQVRDLIGSTEPAATEVHYVPDFQGIAVAYSVLAAAYLLMLAGSTLMSMKQQDPPPH